MTNATGEPPNAQDDGSYVVPLRTTSDSGPPTVRITSGVAASTGQALFATPGRSWRRPSRRMAWIAGLLTACVAAGALGWVGVQQRRASENQRAEARAYEAHAAATRALPAALAGYQLPSSIHADVNHSSCWNGGYCGWTGEAPSAAVVTLLASLRDRGFIGGERRCTNVGKSSESCTADLVRGGESVGFAQTKRDAVDFGLLGRPTTIYVGLASLDDGAVLPPSTKPATPMTDSTLAASALSADLASTLRCTKPVRGGCVEYTARSTVVGNQNDVWRKAGHLMVARGWWSVSGRCPFGYTKDCRIDVTTARKPDGRDRVMVNAVFKAKGSGTQVVVIVSSRSDRA